MNPINFISITQYLKQLWESAVEYCQANYQDIPQDYLENGDLKAQKFFNVEFVAESGALKGAIIEDGASAVRPTCNAVCLVSHSPGSQDSSLQVDMYAQTIKFEMQSPEKYRLQMIRIWEKFANMLKSQIATIDSSSCVFKTDELPNYDKKEANLIIPMDTVECYLTTLETTMVAFLGVVLSNTCTLTATFTDREGVVLQDANDNNITGNILFVNITYSDTIEDRADSTPRPTLRFTANSRQMSIYIIAILTASTINEALRKDIEAGTYLGDIIQMTKTLGDESQSDIYMRSTGKVVYAFGSAVMMEFSLKPTF